MTPGDHWVCVQSVVADERGSLWVIDPAAPATARVVRGGPKLVRIDLASNRVAQVIPFDERVAPQGSYLNDVRFSADGRHAYMTDSGARGAIVVVDLPSGKARRVLDGHPSTQLEKGVVIKADGKRAAAPRRPRRRVRRRRHRAVARRPVPVLAGDQPGGPSTASRPRRSTMPGCRRRRSRRRSRRSARTGSTDGLLIDERGTDRMSPRPEDNCGQGRDDVAAGPPPTILVQDPRLRWPDTFSQGPDGAIYVTTSHIQDSAFFVPTASPRLPTQLWRIEPER